MSKLIERRKHLLKVQDTKGKSVLHYSVEENRQSMVETLLKTDSSLAYLQDDDGLIPLHKAASMGLFSMIQTIIEFSPQSIRIRDKINGRTALHFVKMDACSFEGPECLKNTRMKELINEVDNDGNTPLHLALINSDLATAGKLLEVDDVNWRLTNKQGYSPIDLCTSNYQIPLKLKHVAIEPTIKEGVNMEIFFHKDTVNVDDLLDHCTWDDCLTYQGPEGDTILHVAARDGHMKIIKQTRKSNSARLLLLSGKNFKRETPLHLAAQQGRFEVVTFILSLCSLADKLGNHENHSTILTLENGDGNHLANAMPWRMRSANGDTPLHKAIRNRHANIALLLFRRDPDLISFTNNAKESPLYLAANSQCFALVRKILSNDREFDDSITSGRDGQNVLHAAARARGVSHCKRLMIEQPHLLKKVDANGKTPLHYAIEHSRAWTARWLLKQDKSTAFVYDNEGFTPLLRAAAFGYGRCMRYILDLCPQSVELRDLSSNGTVLHLANLSGFILKQCMTRQVLVNLINETDKDGNTALHRAILDGDVDKALVLLETKGLNWRIKNKLHQSPWDLCVELKRSGKMEQRPVFIGLYSLGTAELILPKAPKLISGMIKNLLMAYSNMIMTEDNAKKLVDNVAVAAGLLLTITSAATFTIPGAYDQNTGDSIRMKQTAIKVFLASDVLAMLMCVSILVRYTLGVGGRSDKLRKLAIDSIIMLQISLLATVVAFISGAYAIASHYRSVITIPIIVAALLNLVMLFRFDFFEFDF